MTLVDTSAWVEFLRATGSDVHHELRRLLDSETTLHTTDVIVMEVLAGARDEPHLTKLRRLVSTTTFLPINGLDDFERAAELYRRCRRAGETVRALNDCLIAAVALRSGVDVLAADRDFDVLARHSELQLHPPATA